MFFSQLPATAEETDCPAYHVQGQSFLAVDCIGQPRIIGIPESADPPSRAAIII